jgi:hypothetical protein
LHGRVRLTNGDRWFFIQLYRWFPSVINASHNKPNGRMALPNGRSDRSDASASTIWTLSCNLISLSIARP